MRITLGTSIMEITVFSTAAEALQHSAGAATKSKTFNAEEGRKQRIVRAMSGTVGVAGQRQKQNPTEKRPEGNKRRRRKSSPQNNNFRDSSTEEQRKRKMRFKNRSGTKGCRRRIAAT